MERSMEQNRAERATKAEIDTSTDSKAWASSVGSCQRHKPQHVHHVKVSPRGPITEKYKETRRERGRERGR